MADYQRIVELLRDVRQGPLQSVTDEISQAAAEYATLCAQANERLRQCSTYLQQGLRTEAIHLAEESPNLLDLVAALDLPDPQTWMEFCMNNGLPVPPQLQFDRAAQLNEAYAQDQPLEHLLANHRLLALARGPINERLRVMRQIAQADSANPNWEKDIRLFEKARLKELPTAFLNAVKYKDEGSISSLMTEVSEEPWYEPVPEDIRQGVTDAFNRMQRANVEIELQKLVPALRDAYAARSLKECQAITQQWKNAMQAAGVQIISPELTDEIRPVLAFIAEQEKREEFLKRFRNSCKAFGQMLDRDASNTELEAGYAKLKEFSEPIPPELTQRYADKQTSRQKTVERGHKLRLVGIAATAALVLIVALITIYLIMRSSSAAGWAQKLQRANAEKNLAQAQLYVDDLRKNHPGFLSETAVAAAVRETEALQSAFERDAGTINGLLTKIDSTLTTVGPIAANQNASPEETLTAAAAAQEILEQSRAAGDLSWADADKKLASALIKIQNTYSTLASRASGQIRTELDALSAKLDAIPAAPVTNAGMTQANADLTAISRKVSDLKDLRGLDDDTKAAVNALAQKVDERHQSVIAARDVAGDLDTLRQVATSADDLKKALAAFIQRFPNDSRTPDFTEALSRMPLAKAVESWRQMSAKWPDMAPSSGADAQRRMDQIVATISANPDSPMAATATAYLDYLKKATDAMATSGTWQTAFQELMEKPQLVELEYMETSDGKRYYTLGDIKRVDGHINNQLTVRFEALDPQDLTKRRTIIIDPPIKVLTAKPVKVPHAVVMQEMAEQIKLIDEHNWDTWGIDVTDQLIKNTQMDIVVKAILVQQALKTQTDIAGWALGDTYSKTLLELARQKPEGITFLDPEKVTEGMRRSLKGTLDAIPPGKTVKPKLRAAEAALFKKVAFEVAATGVLLKDDSGNMSVALRGERPTAAALWTVLPGTGTPAPAPAPAEPAAPPTTEPDATAPALTPPAETVAPTLPPGNPGTLVNIGSITDKKITLDSDAIRAVPQGSMIFVTRP